MSHPHKRKNWIINPKLQYRLIAMSGGFVVLVSIILHMLINYLYHKVVKILTILEPRNLEETLSFMEEQKFLFEAYTLISFAVIVAIFSYFALRETNRIAGPIYNLTNKMKAFRETGECREVTFRKGDYFIELQKEYNLLLKSIAPSGPEAPVPVDERSQAN